MGRGRDDHGEFCNDRGRCRKISSHGDRTSRGISVREPNHSLIRSLQASYYIGLGKKVVLCTQQLSENTLVHGERLSAYQAKDYNRCRMYLSDQACRNNVPVLDSIEDAVAKAAALARE